MSRATERRPPSLTTSCPAFATTSSRPSGVQVNEVGAATATTGVSLKVRAASRVGADAGGSAAVLLYVVLHPPRATARLTEQTTSAFPMTDLHIRGPSCE